MKRPYISFGLDELTSLSEKTSDARVLKQVLAELSKRETKGAKRLEAFVRQKQLDVTSSTDLFLSRAASTALPVRSDLPIFKRIPGKITSVRKPKNPPTEEQLVSIDAFMTGGSLKTTAFAGAGKTSTLVQMADKREGAGLYLAFNRSIADEAKSEFLPSVDCRTTHSVALRSVRAARGFQQDKLFTVIKANQLAKVLDLKSKAVANALTFSDVQQAYLFSSTVRQFCQSRDEYIAERHVPLSGRLLGLEEAQRAEIVTWAALEARRLWARMTDPQDEMPLGHDGYLKLWSLSDPILDYDYVLMDEAQDTNPAVMRVLERQKTQIVYVGDQHQQIYGWRGAVNAMAEANTANSTYLTQSFRFGPSIAEAASRILRTLGESKAIRGNPSITSLIAESGAARTVLCRTNATVISEVMEALDRQQKPHIIGGTEETLKLVGSVYELMNKKPASHPDFFGFVSWDQAVTFSETDEGEDIRPFVSLVQKYGHGGLYRALKLTAAEENDADIVVSTAHKSKGRQWPSVRVADDFGGVQSETGAIPEEESRLFYVAITRAQKSLIVSTEILQGYQRGRLPPKEKVQSFGTRRTEPAVQPRTAAPRPAKTAVPVASQKQREPLSRPIVSDVMQSVPQPRVASTAQTKPADPQPTFPTKKKGFFARIFGP